MHWYSQAANNCSASSPAITQCLDIIPGTREGGQRRGSQSVNALNPYTVIGNIYIYMSKIEM